MKGTILAKEKKRSKENGKRRLRDRREKGQLEIKWESRRENKGIEKNSRKRIERVRKTKSREEYKESHILSLVPYLV